MANDNLNCVSYFIVERVMMNIGQNVSHIRCMYLYNSQYRKIIFYIIVKSYVNPQGAYLDFSLSYRKIKFFNFNIYFIISLINNIYINLIIKLHEFVG